MRVVRSKALQASLVYLVCASAWMILADDLIIRFARDKGTIEALSQLKDLVFALVTTLVLFVILRRYLHSVDTARAAWKESQERFVAFMEHLPGGASLRDRQGRFVYANRFWIENFFQGREWLYRRPEDFFEAEYVRGTNEDMAKVLAGERIVDRTSEFRIGGETRQFLFRRFPVFLGTEAFVGAFAIDVTERARIEAALRQADKLETMGLLASGIAHDFNNLLTVVNGWAHALRDTSMGREEIEEAATEILGVTYRGSNLTSRLLLFARDQSPRYAPQDLNEIVQGSVAYLGRLLGRNVRIECSLAPRIPPLFADRGQVEQILLNLVINARDANKEGGLIQISTEPLTLACPEDARKLGLDPGQYVRLTVRDTGIGMDAATIEKIFEPFFTTKGPGKGSGLGLATVNTIVRSLGGTIRVKSAPGQGTSFEIDFPVSSAPSAAATETGRSRDRARILLVEDDDAVRLLTRSLLEQLDHEVVDTPSAAKALELCATGDRPFDLLMTDLSMPGMDGAELVRQVRAIDPGLPVLFFSGYSGEPAHYAADPRGIPILGKPFTVEALAQALQRAFGSSASASSVPARSSSRPPGQSGAV